MVEFAERETMWRVLLVGVALVLALFFGVLFFGGEEGAVNPLAPSATGGAALYREACAGCHGPRGEGVAGVPALAGRGLSPDFVAMTVRRGRRNMPRFPHIRGEALENLARHVSELQ